jgi:hypothetical protein
MSHRSVILKRASFLSSRILKKDALWVGVGRACWRPIGRISRLKSRDVDFAQVHRNCAQILPTGDPLDHVLVVAARIRAGPIHLTGAPRDAASVRNRTMVASSEYSDSRNISRSRLCAILLLSLFGLALLFAALADQRAAPFVPFWAGLCNGSTIRGAVLTLS